MGMGGAPGEPSMVDALDVDAAWRLHYADMVGLAALLCGSRRDAEDLVQDVFVELQRRPRDVRDLAGYLRVAVVNRCRRWQRRERLARRHRVHAQSVSGDPEVDTILRLIARLRPKQRTAILLRFYADLSMAQIADAMSCTEATARSHVRRGLAKLEEMLAC
jgi:RNA polymerase sigma factor (sigma-70 family)